MGMYAYGEDGVGVSWVLVLGESSCCRWAGGVKDGKTEARLNQASIRDRHEDAYMHEISCRSGYGGTPLSAYKEGCSWRLFSTLLVSSIVVNDVEDRILVISIMNIMLI